jgi:glycosyltransferase involved in cell wall biosynthesis
MERVRAVRPRRPGDFTADAVAALRTLPSGEEPPLLLAYLPAFETNPYQALLYATAREHGIAPVPMHAPSQFAELPALAAAGHETVAHLHWLHVVTREAGSEADARAQAAAFLEQVDAYLALGGRLAWTVHNILPHDTPYPAVETWLAGEVARRAHAIHVMATNTRELVAPYYDLPADRVFAVPHPGYGRAYPDSISRLDARQELGLDPDELVGTLVGSIRPYKGLDELLDAWALLDADRPRRLLIAGMPSRGSAMAPLLERAALEPNVILDARRIDAAEMQVFLRAADFAVLPYRRALNSGAVMLALTFGLPIIVPEGGGLEELVDPAYARTFVAGDADSLVAALRSIPDLLTPAARAAAEAVAAARDPIELSHRFVTTLRAALFRPAATPPSVS